MNLLSYTNYEKTNAFLLNFQSALYYDMYAYSGKIFRIRNIPRFKAMSDLAQKYKTQKALLSN